MTRRVKVNTVFRDLAQKLKVGTELRSVTQKEVVAGGTAPVNPTAPPTTSGNPFAGKTLAQSLYNPAKNWTDQNQYHAYAALIKERISNEPISQWAYATRPGGQSVYDWIDQRRTAMGNNVGVITLYNIPMRDLGSYAAGGASSAAEYTQWITDIIAGLKGRPTVLLYEPDALPHSTAMSTTDRDARHALMRDSIKRLADAGHYVYIDAGGPRWKTVNDIVSLLHAVDAENARGFCLNIANFVPTVECQNYGVQVSNAFGGTKPLRFIIDTSRNGNPDWSGSDVFNPPNRALGARQGSTPTESLCDAYIWVKGPGESDASDGSVEFDGSVAPPSGTFWPAYAYKLAERATWYTAPAPGAGAGTVLFEDNFDGAAGTRYFFWDGTGGTNKDATIQWYADHLSGNYLDYAGSGIARKTATNQFWRAWPKKAYGGPGKKISIKGRVRLTSVIDNTNSSIIEGLKLFCLVPSPNNPDQGPSGATSNVAEYQPGSTGIFITSRTGYVEISRNNPAPVEGYDWSFYSGTQNAVAPLTVGTWTEFEVQIHWLGNNTNRVMMIRDGKLWLDITDNEAQYFQKPLYFGLRSDDCTWEVDYFKITDIT